MRAPFSEKDANVEVNVYPEAPAVDIYWIFALEERRRGGLLNVTWTLTSMDDADIFESPGFLVVSL